MNTHLALWQQLFDTSAHSIRVDWGWLDVRFVSASVLIAMFTAGMGLHMLGIARRYGKGLERSIALLSAVVVLGGGIWSMHIIGMLAFEPFANGRFGLLHTLLSFIPVLLAATGVTYVLQTQHLSWWRFALAGIFIEAGVVAMHFEGVLATELASYVRYTVQDFATALGVGMLLITAALATQLMIDSAERKQSVGASIAGGIVMGLAQSAVTYLLMGFMRLESPPPELLLPMGQMYWSVVIATGAVSLLLALIVLVANVVMRYRQLFAQMSLTQARLRTVVDTAVDGIIMIEADGTMVSFNRGAENLLGYKAEEVIGRNVSMLMPEPHRSAHDGYLHHHMQTGQTKIIGHGREVQAQHKDGTLIDVRLAVGRSAMVGQRPLFVGFLSDLRQRKAMEADVRRSEEQHRTLIANIPGVAFRRSALNHWRPIFLSAPIEGLTGYAAQDFLDGRVSLAELMHPHDVSEYTAVLDAAMQQQTAYSCEWRVRHRDGSIRWASESGRGVYGEDGSLSFIDGVVLDITASKNAQAEHMATAAAINRSMAVIEYDLDGRICRANDNFLSLFGYPAEAIVGHNRRMFLTEGSEDQGAVRADLLAARFHVGEYAYADCDGQLLWVHTSFNPILDSEGKTARVMQLMTDITARRRMEADLVQARDRAEAAAAARSTFLANMSHEIRTPMNAIIGFSEALLETPLQPQQLRHVEIVHRSARSMLRLLNDILDTAKLDKGAVKLEIDDFSPHDLCALVLGAQRIHAEKKGLALKLSIPDDVPSHFKGDALRVQQIVTNLLGNAVKFTERGSVKLGLRYHPNDALPSRGELEIFVQDTGIGITQEQINRIFDPFSQADASTTRKYGGTGLGTTISRQLAELMGGRITVESEHGVGSRFTVWLPLPVGSQPAQAREAHLAKNAQVGAALPPLSILGVDDVPQNLELLEMVLRKQGHEVHLAADGEQAVRMRQAHRFDLILMDLQMPVMDGLAATANIRAWERETGQKPVPIIALSASVLEQDRSAADAAGMDGFAAKPLELPKLLAEMTRVLIAAGRSDIAQAAAQANSATTAQTPDMSLQQKVAGLGLDAATLKAAAGVADVAAGVQLWGSLSALRAGWIRFMAEQQGRGAHAQHLIAQGDWAAVAAMAHRARGAAGNLSLTGAAAVLGHIEAAAQAQDRARMDAQVPTLYAALGAIERLIHASEDAAQADAAAHVQQDSADVAATRDTPALLRDLDAAAQSLRTGEVPDALLAQLNAQLTAAERQPLQDALDGFDFDAALAHIAALQSALSSAAGAH